MLRSNPLETGLAQSGSRTDESERWGRFELHVATIIMRFGAGKASERQHVKVFSEQMSWRRVRSRPPGRMTELRGCGRAVSERDGGSQRPFEGRGESRSQNGRVKRESTFLGHEEVSRVL